MITRCVVGKGVSGAVRYVLGEGRDPETGELIHPGPDGQSRVAWFGGTGFGFEIESREDAELARRMMEFDAINQTSRTKRCEKDCVHLAMSWRPGETPTRAEMETAAKSALESLGMENARAIFAAHSDESYSHVHIVASKINPETGKAYDLRGNYLKLSKWAQDYEQTHGGIVCLGREDANRLRDAIAELDAGKVLEAMTEHRATFTTRDLEKTLAKQIKDSSMRGEFAAMVLGQKEIVHLRDQEKGPVTRHTTKTVLKAEQEVLSATANLNRDRVHDAGVKMRSVVLESAAFKTVRREQVLAVRAATGESALALIDGQAGTGKSYTMSAIRQVYEKAGRNVIGLAPTNVVAQDMQRDGFKKAATVHSQLFALNNGRESWNRRTVVMVDEATMLDTPMLAKLAIHAQASGAKLILVGDDRQLASIRRGGMFGVLKDRYGAASLSEVTRQRKDDDRRASSMMAEGNFYDALQMYEAKGAIRWTQNQEQARSMLVKQWAADAAAFPDKTRFVFAYTNIDVAKLNADLRSVRRTKGELGDDHLLRTAEGDQLFAKGDRVQLTKTDKQDGLCNGMIGTIEKIDGPGVTVRFDGRKPSVRSFNAEIFPYFRHGYAGTVYKGQGTTLDHSYLYHSEHWRSSASYVALTRHRDKAKLFVARNTAADVRQLARQMARVEERRAASHFFHDEDFEPAGARPPHGGMTSAIDLNKEKMKRKVNPLEISEDEGTVPICAPQEVMAADPKRRETAPTVKEQTEVREQPAANEQIAAREVEIAKADKSHASNQSQYQSVPYPPDADMVSQQAAALKDAAARNEKLRSEGKVQEPKQEKAPALDHQASAPNRASLKMEPPKEKPKVIFFEDELKAQSKKVESDKENEKPREKSGSKVIFFEDIYPPSQEHDHER